jgi:hypothetical protein
LFLCNRCRKAFTFAEGVEIKESWEQTAERTVRAIYQRDPEPGQAAEWTGAMKILLKDIQPGRQYVYFDGWVIPTTAKSVHIIGWHSWHALEFVPQVAALNDPEIRRELLSSREYWLSTAARQDDA